MSSTRGGEEILTSPTEQQANGQAEEGMDAKLIVATASGDVQQLKDKVQKQESQMMVVVMAKQQAAPVEKYRQGNMHPHLLALASCGSCEELRTFLNGEDSQASGNGTRSYGDPEANESILAGRTAEGDTALHVVAASGLGCDSFLTPSPRWRRWCLGLATRAAEHHALYGDGDNFLECARIIHKEDKKLLFAENSKGDTPLHCAARAGKCNMVKCLIDLARDEGGEGEDTMSMMLLLRKQNKDKETALHQAVRAGNNYIVSLLMDNDKELASFPAAEDGGASPLYLAYVLQRGSIAKTLHEKSNGKLSISGQNGQNLLHAAVLRRRDLTKLLKKNEERRLCPQNKDLTTQGDKNGSTPLHFAASRPSRVCRQVLKANPDALYQPDHAGFFPIHVAASVGASWNVNMFVKEYPGSAGLRDAKGRTFLHVAVEENKANVISVACSNRSLSWIMNMVDNDGKTALHLAVEAGRLRMFCPLVGNLQVNLNLPNNRGETPLDIAEYKVPEFHYNQSSEAQIRRTLRIAGAVNGVRRRDPLENNKAATVKHGESKTTEALKDSTGTLCIGSVLITTVTFGATFAVPGGYIADDHSNGGSPILARRYAFDAFIASNTLAFVFSTMATAGLMYSGSSFLSLRNRQIHFTIAVYLLSISVKSLASAFALGAYVVLTPVSHKTAVATCVLTCLVLLYTHLEFIWRRLLLLPPIIRRKGLIWASVCSAMLIVGNMLVENWPLIFIFGWAAHSNPAHKIEAAAQAPVPLRG